jgi:Ca-activated chloride channel homolog
MRSLRNKLAPRPLAGLAALAALIPLSLGSVHCSSADDDDDSTNGFYPGRNDGGAGSPSGPPSNGGGRSGGSNSGGGAGGGGPGVDRDGPGQPELPSEAPACAALDSTKPLELFLSSDDSNSMASPVIARRMIRDQGQVPSARVLRTYEFLNYYNVNYGAFGFDAHLRVNAAGEFELQIGVQAPPNETRRPMTLTFVLDTSGSMAGRPFELMLEAVRAAATQLRAGDVVSLVTWNTENRILLSGRTVEGPNDGALLSALNTLRADGGTDLHGGLVEGYRLAEAHDGLGRVNRIIVISDGVANVGVTDEQLIAEKSNSENKEGIYLVGVGVGEGINDTLMDTVTDAGNGAYIYLDSKDEAQRMLGQRFSETVEVAARNVQVKARLPWYLSMRRFYGEEYSTEPYRVKPQHLAPGDSMVISQVLASCAGAPVVDADPIEVVADWVEPLTYQKKNVAFASTVGALKASTRAELARGKAIIAYAEWLKAYASADPDTRAGARNVLALVDAADVTGTDAAFVEIRDLVTRLEPSAGDAPSVEP